MITYSAPGKIYLFGEHAILYGGLALACAIDLRTYVTAKKSDRTIISSDIGRTGLDYDIHPYISCAIKKICDDNNVSINIISQIPISSGLGSSAAATIGTLAAINKEFELGYKKEEIAKMGQEVEQGIQGHASPTDTYLSVFGGMFKFPTRKRFNILDCYIVIGNTNISKNTSQIINQIRTYKNEFPELINPIIDVIGSISKEVDVFIKQKDYKTIGKLMNMNHGLLNSLGVSTRELDSLVYAARYAGAFGAKITGAGGGGCMIAITDSPKNVAIAIEKAGGSAIITRITEKGLVQEE